MSKEGIPITFNDDCLTQADELVRSNEHNNGSDSSRPKASRNLLACLFVFDEELMAKCREDDDLKQA